MDLEGGKVRRWTLLLLDIGGEGESGVGISDNTRRSVSSREARWSRVDAGGFPQPSHGPCLSPVSCLVSVAAGGHSNAWLAAVGLPIEGKVGCF